jgi:hypothetical protein
VKLKLVLLFPSQKMSKLHLCHLQLRQFRTSRGQTQHLFQACSDNLTFHHRPLPTTLNLSLTPLAQPLILPTTLNPSLTTPTLSLIYATIIYPHFRPLIPIPVIFPYSGDQMYTECYITIYYGRKFPYLAKICM